MHYTDLLNFMGNNLVDISARAVEIGSDYNMILVNAPTKDIGTRLLVPAQYVNKENNTILLNIQPHAISPITVANGAIQFSTRFNKVLHDLYISLWVISSFTKFVLVSIKFMHTYTNGQFMAVYMSASRSRAFL